MLPACAIRSAKLEVELRSQVAHEAGNVRRARILGQEEKHAALLYPVWLWITEQAIDCLVIGMRSQEGERRDKRAGADTGNAVELWQRVRA